MLLLALAFATTQLATEEQYGFQDSKLGASLGDWQRAHPAATCGNGELPGEVECITPKPDFLPAGGVSYYFTSANQPGEDRLWKIELIGLRGGETPMLDGLTGKWGKPHKYGLYADTWSRSGSTIRYMRLSGGGAAATFTDDAVEDRRAVIKRDRASKSF